MAKRGSASAPLGWGPQWRACARREVAVPARAKGKTVAERAQGGGRWPTRSSMDHVERCAWFFRGTLVRVAVRRYLPWAMVTSMLAGSLLKELSPLPESYLSNKRNVLNMYFVKVAWAWTLSLLLPFIALTNYHLTGKAGLVLRRLSTLLVGTAIWYVCTAIFSSVEHYTGSCYQSPALEGIRKEQRSKQQCHREGGFWHGFDISGHSFLLTFCALMIVEEMAVLQELKTDRSQGLHTAITSLVVALGFLTFIWVWMFLCTAVYFHDLPQKVLGTLFGLLGWYGTYGFWYLKSFSPGLPPQSSSLNLKRDSYKK
ncbi:acyl-coenzyme A diphosphatase FITM2 [Saccopteryx leptura]|uniref:acyl-coenzyme A diphosphatase FITM2 n=1 Tax=Saccopteryx leptura TaxID=249018 RepID=UPI00339BFA6B